MTVGWRDIRELVATRGEMIGTLKDDGYVKPRTRKLVNFHPCGSGEVWGVHNNSKSNIERALVERVFTVKGEDGKQVLPPLPKPGVVEHTLKVFAKKIIHLTGRVPPMSTEQFVDTYVGRKRRMYEMSGKSLDDRPISRKDAYINAFIKDEKSNLTRKNDPCPRLIQPCSSRFNVAIGKHLKPMEKKIFRSIGRIFGGTTVMKGLNARQRGTVLFKTWSKFTDPVAVLIDASRWDQHCSDDIIAWEHKLEEAIALDRTELKRLNKLRRKSTGFARCDGGGFRYRTNGKRMSGAMDTASGNCTTMCGLTWSYLTGLKIGKFSYLNDGDDGGIIIERRHLEKVLSTFQSWFLLRGFTMKLEGIANRMEEFEFCQARPIFDGENWTFVRDPTICLGKDSISLKGKVDVTKLKEFRNSVGWCGLSLAGNMPIFNEFYYSMISDIRPDQEFTTGMQFMARGMVNTYSKPTFASRISFYLAYGINPESQMTIENTIRNSSYQIKTPAVQVINIQKSIIQELYLSTIQ